MKEKIKTKNVEMKKLTPVKTLRLLTDMFNTKYAEMLIPFINLIARKLDGCQLLEDDFLIKQFKKLNIELDLEEINRAEVAIVDNTIVYKNLDKITIVALRKEVEKFKMQLIKTLSVCTDKQLSHTDIKLFKLLLEEIKDKEK